MLRAHRVTPGPHPFIARIHAWLSLAWILSPTAKRWYLLDSVARAGGRILAVFALARLLSPESFAQFVLLATLDSIGGGILSSLIHQPLARTAPGLNIGPRNAIVRVAQRRGYALLLIWIAVSGALVTSGALGPITWRLAAGFVLAQLFSNLLGLRIVTFLVDLRFRRQCVSSMMTLGLLCLVFAIMIIVGADPHEAYWSSVAVGCITTLVLTRSRDSQRPNSGVVDTRRLNGVTASQASVLAAAVISQRVQPFVLASQMGADAVRLFGGTMSVLGPLRLSVNTIVGLLEPVLACMHGRGPSLKARRLLLQVLGAIALSGTVLVAFGALFEPTVSRLVLGSKFPDLGGCPWIAILYVVAESVSVVLLLFVQIFHARGPRVAAVSVWLSAITAFCLLWPAIGLGGTRGAIVAMAIGASAQVAWLLAAAGPLGRPMHSVSTTRRLRSLARMGFEYWIGRLLLLFRFSFARDPGVQVLCLHRMDLGDERRLDQIVEELGRTHAIVSYSQAVNESANPRRPMIALSFDDGTLDHFEAAKTLSSLGISACFFVCPDLLDVAGGPEELGLSAERLGTTPTRLLTWSQLAEIHALGHEIGCHSAGHHDLASLAPPALHEQISVAGDRLEQRGVRAEHFAWPFGRFSRFSPTAAAIAIGTGFRSCASTEPGCHIGGSTNRVPCVRRIVIGETESARSVICRMAFHARFSRIHSDGWPGRWGICAPRCTGPVPQAR